MQFLDVVTTPPVIYRGFSIWKTFWEEKFTPVNMTSCGRLNVNKHRKTNIGEKYIILDISSKLDCMEKMEFTYS